MKLDIYLPDFQGGGVERVTLLLLQAFAHRGVDVGVVVHRRSGQLEGELPAGVRVVVLGAGRTLSALSALSAHLRGDPPDILLSNLGHNNIVALWARAWVRVRARALPRALPRARDARPIRLIICQHNALSAEARQLGTWQHRALPRLYRWFGGWADAIVGVSDGVCDDMAEATGLPRRRFTTLYNPVIDDRYMRALAAAPRGDPPPPGSPWRVLAMGRLVPQKDHATLLRAFALLSDATARLTIAGAGPELPRLQALASTLGVAGRVDFPGFVADPVRLLRRADVFVLSSAYEGLGNVLVEALGCGVPVVSTRCPHGPAEILGDGAYGVLVPVGDAAAMAHAMRQQRDAPWPSVQARVARASSFAVDPVVDRYLALFDRVLQPAEVPAGRTRGSVA